MSKETVQFVELVRRAAGNTEPHYCQHCGRITQHSVRQSGRDEIYTCRTCGYQKWYTVR